MGIIYRYVSPSGKSYIGQTTMTMEDRWKFHVYDCNRALKTNNKVMGSRALTYAIMKYGKDSFKKEVLLACDDSMLDEYEQKMIHAYNTIQPYGYNLRSGGGANHTISDETRLRVQQNTKEALVNLGTKLKRIEPSKDLPLYLGYFAATKYAGDGYRLRRHPLCKDKCFYTKTYGSLIKAKEAALRFYRHLEDIPLFEGVPELFQE